MEDHASVLYSAVMTSSDDFTVNHEYRSNRDAAFDAPKPGFLDRRPKERSVVQLQDGQIGDRYEFVSISAWS